MPESGWLPYQEGATLGHTGSEEGTIVRDEEHALGARITLERSAHSAPMAITCGIYGWMLHTRFFGSEAEAGEQYEQMKNAIADLLEAAERAANDDAGRRILMDGVSTFVENFP